MLQTYQRSCLLCANTYCYQYRETSHLFGKHCPCCSVRFESFQTPLTRAALACSDLCPRKKNPSWRFLPMISGEKTWQGAPLSRIPLSCILSMLHIGLSTAKVCQLNRLKLIDIASMTSSRYEYYIVQWNFYYQSHKLSPFLAIFGPSKGPFSRSVWGSLEEVFEWFAFSIVYIIIVCCIIFKLWFDTLFWQLQCGRISGYGR